MWAMIEKLRISSMGIPEIKDRSGYLRRLSEAAQLAAHERRDLARLLDPQRSRGEPVGRQAGCAGPEDDEQLVAVRLRERPVEKLPCGKRGARQRSGGDHDANRHRERARRIEPPAQ